jgi:hypothetical protein
VAKCTVECRHSRRRWIAVVNVKWREGIERSRGVYVVGNVDPLAGFVSEHEEMSVSLRWTLAVKVDGCLARV